MPTIGTMGIRLSHIRISGELPRVPYMTSQAYRDASWSPAGYRLRWSALTGTGEKIDHTGDDLWYDIGASFGPASGAGAAEGIYPIAPIHSFCASVELKSAVGQPVACAIVDDILYTSGDGPAVIAFDQVSETDWTEVHAIGRAVYPYDVDECHILIKALAGGDTVSIRKILVYAWDAALLPVQGGGSWPVT